MARLRSIIRGTRQFRTVEVPLKNMLGDGVPTSVSIGLTIVSDYGQVLEGATKYAEAHGAKPEPGNETYDYGKAVYTVALTAVDSESDPANPRPFFGASDNPSVEERVVDVLSHPNIGRDTVMYLAECQEVWQDECHPQSTAKSDEEYMRIIAEATAEGPLAFLRQRPATRLRLLHFSACQLPKLLEASMTSGSLPTITP
jgi:hypothetical protein